ncbi:MAG: hypothetical protein R3C97_09515 [Geminicoccaceae bacterium]
MLHAWLAQWYNFLIQQGWSVDVQADGTRALDHVKRALDIDPGCSLSLTMNGLMQTFFAKNFEDAAASYDEAILIDPNNPLAWLFKSTLLAFSDQGPEAVQSAARARRLSPLDPHRFLYDALSATAHSAAGEVETALQFAEKSWEANHRHSSTLRSMIVAKAELGKMAEARHLAGRLLHFDPNFRVNAYLKNHPASTSACGRRWAETLAKAGVPYE